MLGDFNIPNFGDGSSSCPRAVELRDFCNLLGFSQHNSVLNNNNRILDLVFACDDDIDVFVDRSDLPFVREDPYHPALNIMLKKSYKRQANFPIANYVFYNFKRANMESLLSSIDSFNWDELKSFDHVDDALDFFYEKLFQMIEDHVPKKKYTPVNNRFPVWFTASIKRNIRLKNFYRSKWLRTRNQNCRAQFVRLRALIKSEISSAYDDYVTSIMEKMKLDPKIFWKFINQKKNCSRIPGVMYVDEELHASGSC